MVVVKVMRANSLWKRARNGTGKEGKSESRGTPWRARTARNGAEKEGKSAEIEKRCFLEGTNYVKSFAINKSVKKRTQNELVFECKKGQTKLKIGQKSTFFAPGSGRRRGTQGGTECQKEWSVSWVKS
jgi:hypothetical protein